MSASMVACDNVLDVELPHILSDDAVDSPGTAELQVNSAIGLFECGYSSMAWTALGHEDVQESIAGVAQTAHSYLQIAPTGNCDASSQGTAWFDQIMGARTMLTRAPSRLVPSATGNGLGVYDRMQDEWQLGASEERLSSIAAIYVAASLTVLGEFFCEVAFDGSELLTPPEVLAVAEAWITDRALVHIANSGGFAMPHGIATSAQNMARALRARIRWANGDLAGAVADAASIPQGFTAWVTRDAGDTRRNKIYHASFEIGYSGMNGVVDWWNPAARRPNPVTGVSWPNPIPFTGYLFLGIMPDGRTLEAGNIPVRWAQEVRTLGNPPTPLGNGALADTRVLTTMKAMLSPKTPGEAPARYASNDDDIPLVTWEEMRLIQADYEHSLGNYNNAIDFVNVLRTARGLPLVSGAYRSSLTDGTADADDVRYLLLEERRREFYAEGGRYWSTKIKNTDVLWFPRGEGSAPFAARPLQGGVRMALPNSVYQLNPHFVALGGLSARGVGCAGLPGSQAPVIG
jgi:hypothetical protein